MSTGNPVSSAIRASRSRSSAPPPVNTIPCSAISAASSGGDCSRAILTARMIASTGSSSAVMTSVLLRVNVRGTPSARWRPLTSISRCSLFTHTQPTSCFMRSAVASPMRQPNRRRTCATIASSKRSPPTRIESLYTTPLSEIRAISVVPPPISTTMQPMASSTLRPAPIAAAMGSSINLTSRAPAPSAERRIASRSTWVERQGTQMSTRGLGLNHEECVSCTLRIKC